MIAIVIILPFSGVCYLVEPFIMMSVSRILQKKISIFICPVGSPGTTN